MGPAYKMEGSRLPLENAGKKISKETATAIDNEIARIAGRFIDTLW
jgi:hypothetical protein